MNEWQPIETAPRDGELILLSNSDGVWVGKYTPVYASGFVPQNKWSSWLLNHDHFKCSKSINPTHWMPLPESPEDNTNKVFKCYCGKTEIIGRSGCCKDPDCIPW